MDLKLLSIFLLTLIFLVCIILYTFRSTEKLYYTNLPKIYKEEWFVYTATSIAFIGVLSAIFLNLNSDNFSPPLILILTCLGVSAIFLYYNLYYNQRTDLVFVSAVGLFISTVILTLYLVINSNHLFTFILALPMLVLSIFFIYCGSISPLFSLQINYTDSLEINSLKNSKGTGVKAFLLQFSSVKVNQLLQKGDLNLKNLLISAQILDPSGVGYKFIQKDFETYLVKLVNFEKGEFIQVLPGTFTNRDQVYLVLQPKNQNIQAVNQYELITLLARQMAKADPNYAPGNNVSLQASANIQKFYINSLTPQIVDENQSIHYLLSVGDNHGGVELHLSPSLRERANLPIYNSVHQSNMGVQPLNSSGKYMQFGVSSDGVSSILQDPCNTLINLFFQLITGLLNKRIAIDFDGIPITFSYPILDTTGTITTVLKDINFGDNPMTFSVNNDEVKVYINEIKGLNGLQIVSSQSGCLLVLCNDDPTSGYLDLTLVLTTTNPVEVDATVLLDDNLLLLTYVNITNLFATVTLSLKVPITIINNTTTTSTTIETQNATIEKFDISFDPNAKFEIEFGALAFLDPIIDGIVDDIQLTLENLLSNLLVNDLSNVLLNMIHGITNPSFNFVLPAYPCTVFHPEIPVKNILNSYLGDVIAYDGIEYSDNYFTPLNTDNYVKTTTGNANPQFLTSNQIKYICPTASVPVISDDETLNGCYSCPTGSSMLITKPGPSITATAYNGDTYPLTQYNSRLICASNIVKNIPFNPIVSSYNVPSISSTFFKSINYDGICYAASLSNELIITPSSLGPTTLNNNTNIILPSLGLDGSKNDYDNFYAVLNPSYLNGPTNGFFNVQSQNETVESGNYFCAGIQNTQLKSNAQTYTIFGGDAVSRFVPGTNDAICIVETFDTQVILSGEMFCETDIVKISNFQQTLKTNSTSVATDIQTNVLGSGSNQILSCNFNVSNPISGYDPTCTVYFYGIDGSGNKTPVDIVSKKLSVFTQIPNVSYYINNLSEEMNLLSGVPITGYEYLSYQIVGGGGRGGNAVEVDNDSGWDYFGGGGGGSGQIKGYIGGTNSGFNYAQSLPNRPSTLTVNLWDYYNTGNLNVVLGSGGNTTSVSGTTYLKIGNVIIDSASGGENGSDGSNTGNGGDGGDGYNGGGAAGRIVSISPSGFVAAGTFGSGTTSFGGNNGNTYTTDPISGLIASAGNGGGTSAGDGGLAEIGVSVSGGGGGSGTGVLLNGQSTGGDGAGDATGGYVTARNGIDYTGGGGGGGSIGNLSSAFSNPGNGGKGYAILLLYNSTIAQYQLYSKFSNLNQFSSYVASIQLT
jgi:hypothetical protein